jgi:hypothetical protein
MPVQYKDRLAVRTLLNAEIPADCIVCGIDLGKATLRRKKENKGQSQQTKPAAVDLGQKTGLRPVRESRVR